MSNEATARTVYNIICSAGYSAEQACGILGNIQQESNFSTDVLGFDRTGSYGLCQWLGPRKQQLMNYAKKNAVSPDRPTIQAKFIVQELRTTESRANAELLRAKTPEEAAVAFSKWYERPADKYAHNDKRRHYARSWYETLAKTAT
jgi:hypothetical protein